MERPEISGWLLLYLAVLILILPLRWVFAWVIAAVLHELGHIIALRCMGVRVRQLRLGLSGAKLFTEPLTSGQEFVAALAGPAVGVLLLGAAASLPRIAICGAVQSAYNLLPVYPMDGGRAVRCGMELLHIRCAQTICIALEWTCHAALACLGFYGTFVLHLGVLPLLVCLFPIGKKIVLQRGETSGTIGIPKK